jgi:hypothetical protein
MRTRGVVVVAMVVLAQSFTALARAEDASTGTGDEVTAAEQRVQRAECIDACGERYKVCMQREEMKRPGTCGGSAVRCRQACPPKPKRAQSVQPARAVESAPAPVTSTANGDGATAGPSKAAAVPAPHAVVPVTTAPEPPAKPQRNEDATIERGDTAADPAAAKAETRIEPETAAVTTTESVPVAEVPKQSRPRNLARAAWCMFRRCADEDDEPPTCSEVCSDDYQRCVMLGDKRESQTCATTLMRCRDGCADARGAAAAR